MNLLITGGAGFIGSRYARLTVADDPSVHVTIVDKLTYAGNMANLASIIDDPRVTFVQGDICDPALIDRVMRGQDMVIHFAAESHVDRSIYGSYPFVSTNVLGTHVLLEAARAHNLSRFVYVSTDEVYGSIKHGSSAEDAPLNPSSPYSASKAAADLLALSYHRTYGLNVVVTRGSNTYGPYQYPEKIIPLFITRLLDGHKVPLYGDGLNVRDWIHVDDHCQGIRLTASRGDPGHAYNIGGGSQLTNMELTDLLLMMCNASWSRVEKVTDRAGHDRRYSVDTRKISRLGYAPQVKMGSGIVETVAWYRENEAWWRPLAASEAGSTVA